MELLEFPTSIVIVFLALLAESQLVKFRGANQRSL